MNKEKALSEKMEYWRAFLLKSNDEIHRDKKGVLMIESLTMNNFLIDWMNDVEKDVAYDIGRLKDILYKICDRAGVCTRADIKWKFDEVMGDLQ